MKRRRKSSVLSEKTSSDSMKKDEETSEHEDQLEDQTLSLQSTEIFSPIERRRDESSDLGEPSSDQTSHQSEAAEGLSDLLDQETETHPVPLPFLGSETEEITETSEGTPRQPDTESVGSVSSLYLEEGSSLYSSFHPFGPRLFQRDHPGFMPPTPLFAFDSTVFMDDSWGNALYKRSSHSLTKKHEADAKQTLQLFPLDLSLPSNTRFINVSPPAVTSTSTADPSSSLRLDFSLPHQDESHSQYVGPSRTVRKMPEVLNIPTLIPQSENISTEKLPELVDMLEPLCLKYSRQNSAGNNQDEIMESVGHMSHSDPNRSASTDLLLPSGPGLRKGDLSNSSPSLLCPLTHQDPPVDVSILPRAASLPNMKLQSSFEEFTPGFCGDADDETYWFQCSSPGLYQCRVSGLVFDMKGGGDVFYRVVPWNRRFLSRHGKKPAGPLFDISCQQQSVAQLHLPHCEVRSTGRCHFLSVAHLRDESVEFIRPERITETHIIISITGFSAFGNVKDKDSPPDPVRALVLLFYKPPADPGVTSFLNLLLLPGNVVIRDLKRTRKKLFGPETFIDAPPNCKLCVKETYSLSTSPAGESVLVQPAEAEFDPESYNSYFTSIQVILNSIIGDMKLSVKQTKTSCCVWERRVCLVAHRVKPGLPSDQQLKETRTRIIDGISEPVLQSLLDKLLEKKVLSDSEREAVEAEKIRGDKARVLVDTVRRKGAAGSSEMIRFLCELDPFLCKHVGLICEELEPNQ